MALGTALFMLVVVGALLARDRAIERERALGVARFVDAVAARTPAAPLLAVAGERWTVRRASLSSTARVTTETWDVVQVDPAGVLVRVRPADGGPERVAPWRLDLGLAFRDRIVAVEPRPLQVGGRTLDCDRLSVTTGGGMDRLELWVAMDRAAGAPTFPGVVRLEREESRARLCVELQVTSVAPIGSP